MIQSSHGLVVFSHGKDSRPESLKISALRPLVEACGWRTDAVDYTDTNDPVIRKDRLVQRLAGETRPVVLWGSSLGGVVSVFAAREVAVAGLFLLAPAVYWPGHEDLDHRVQGSAIEVVHGWRDDVVPVDLSIRFAREHNATLHLFDDDHLLHNCLDESGRLLQQFLGRLTAASRG